MLKQYLPSLSLPKTAPGLAPRRVAPAVHLIDVETTCQWLSRCKEELTPLWAHREGAKLGKVQKEGRFRPFENDAVSLEEVRLEFIEPGRRISWRALKYTS